MSQLVNPNTMVSLGVEAQAGLLRVPPTTERIPAFAHMHPADVAEASEPPHENRLALPGCSHPRRLAGGQDERLLCDTLSAISLEYVSTLAKIQ